METTRNSILLEKSSLRIILKERRKKLQIFERLQFENYISDSLSRYITNKIVALYYPIDTEVNILNSITKLRNIATLLALPSFQDREFVFRVWRKNSILLAGYKGIPEPNTESSPEIEPEIIVVPLLGFDRKLNRIGYGSGHYDKIIKRYNNAFAIGVAFSQQEVFSIPIDDDDQPLKMIITEKEIITKSKNENQRSFT